MENLLVKVNADVFIIPNHSWKMKNMDDFGWKWREGYTKKTYNDNGIEFDETERQIEVWLVSKDLHSDNVQDHSCRVLIDGEMYRLNNRVLSYIPESLLPSGEGKTSTFVFKDMNVTSCDDKEKTMKIDLEITMTAKQLEYRYCRFGCFEEVLKAV